MSLHPATEKDELILIMHSMLKDLYNNYWWEELDASLEDIEETIRELGIEGT